MGIFSKINFGLTKTRNKMAGAIDDLFGDVEEITDDLYAELEEILVMSDVGVATAVEITERLKKAVSDKHLRGAEAVKEEIKEIVAELLDGGEDMGLVTVPSVVLVIGVNGVGKTTTIGKLAAYYVSQGKSVTLAAADTFRAAAAEQLSVWAERAKVRIVRHEEGSDPSAVIFDAVASAKAKKTDVLIVDTAGRLHVKDNLMKELQKMSRVVERDFPEADFLKLLVLDATTGQNALSQAKTFDEAVGLDGLILTKLDGTAKGGFVFSLADELSLPVLYAGVGEKIGDLEKFDSEAFVDAIL